MRLIAALAGLALAVGVTAADSRQAPVRVTVAGTVAVDAKTHDAADLANVVVWLKPLQDIAAPPKPASGPRPRIVQKNRRFDPHLLVVPIGSAVEFPNRDPFFHNVFSLYDGKRFDLGLSEAGTTRSVTFSRPGVSFIFCNIHPEMSAIVMAVDTPYYAVSDRRGQIAIPDVPARRYRLFVWHERYLPPRDSDYPREIAVAATAPSIGVIRLVDTGQIIAPHTNKYGQEYRPPPPSSPLYGNPGR